jgi:hypothetical protein
MAGRPGPRGWWLSRRRTDAGIAVLVLCGTGADEPYDGYMVTGAVIARRLRFPADTNPGRRDDDA